ncbi:MAG: TlpA family protein disulfide reductase [Gammaproteobacteria bacterium]|nr:TlpA family protein disulfide reductase [Gammaproteobacteria bacterium]
MTKRLLLVLCLFSSGLFAAVPQAVDFSLQDLQGKTHHLSDYRGKWVVVNFWATWCPPCLDEIPELVDFHEKHKAKDAVVLGINFEDVEASYLKNFVSEYLISYPILRGDQDHTEPFGSIDGLPTTYIISPKGEIVSQRVGGVTRAYLEDFIAQQKTKMAQKNKV